MSYFNLIAAGIGVVSCLFGGYSYYQSARHQSHIDSELESRSVVRYRFGENQGEGLSRVGTAITGFWNNRTIMRGAVTSWDPRRLLEGRFQRYRDIGAEGVTLNTRAGDKLFGFYFGVSEFFQRVRAMGGQPGVFAVQPAHPFFQRGEHITIADRETGDSYAGVRIPYSTELTEQFSDLSEFISFCRSHGYKVLWEDTLEGAKSGEKPHGNLVLMSTHDYLAPTLFDKTPEKLKRGLIELRNERQSQPLSTLFGGAIETRGIVFDKKDIAEAQTLFRELNLDNSSWKMVVHGEKLYLLESRDAVTLMREAEAKKYEGLTAVEVRGKAVNPEAARDQAGAVVLTMNQTNSFASFSQEILTFLFNGVNVLAYDNAGKGLSTGKNSQYGMTEAVRSAGDFLIHSKEIPESRILFKGQCAGGLPSSEAGKIYRRSHVWVDQAPRTFYGVAENMAVVVSRQARDVIPAESTSYASRAWRSFATKATALSPLVSKAASLVLPSYDVVTNLRQNAGRHIYTIGVPDEGGIGGDELVPPSHRDAIREQLRREPDSLYLEMPGATHVTDWWKNKRALQSVQRMLDETRISIDPFETRE